MPPSIHGVPIPEWPQKLRRLLPRQNDAVAAKTARAIALGDPVQPAPVTTDPFATDFGQFNEFTLAQGPIYPHQFQTQMFRPPDDGMVAPHSRGTTGWEGQMQPGWGRISGRNAAGVGQLSVDTSTSQMMYGMGNAAAPYGGMDLVSPTSSEPQSFPMLNRMTDFSDNSPYNNLSNFRPIAQQHQPQQYQANQHGNNPDLMGQDETSETSSQTASPSEAALPAGQLQLPAVHPAQPAQPTPAARPCGPVSAVRELPPRAKPGRKPMEHDHANDRRKVQNRQAQRNFRDKRAQKVDDLQRANADLKALLEDVEREKANEFHAQQERINKLVIDKRASRDNAAAWERKYEEERKARLATDRDFANFRELHSHCGELHSQYVSKQMGFPNSIVQTAGRSMAMPPISNTMNTDMHHDHVNQDPDPYAEHEIDITAQWSNGAFNKGPNTTNGQVDWTGSSMDIDKAMGGNCGFCNIDNGSGPCPCREEAVSREPKPTLAPGGCDACIADPERAARCKALADRAEVSQRPNTRHDSIPQQTGYMSCSKLFDSTNLPLPSISELFPGDFHAYPSRNSAAGFDVNEHEVARVLQNLRNNGSAGGAPSSTG